MCTIEQTKGKVYYLVYVKYVEGEVGNMIISGSITKLINNLNGKAVVANYWPITKEEYEECNV